MSGSSLSGRVAIVTGGGGGAGRGTALTLGGRGALIVVNDIRADAAEAVAGQIRGAGGQAVAAGGSVAEPDDVEAVVGTCLGRFGRLDILVNNAGILRRNLIEDTPLEDWDAVIAVHLRGTFLCCRAAMPALIKSGSGRIINTTSTAALAAIPASNAYSAAKGGIAAFSVLMAKELAFYGITVNVVEPLGGAGGSSMGTSPLSERAQRVRRAYGWSYPQRPAGTVVPEPAIPTPLGALIAFLGSVEAGNVSGQILGVTNDGYRVWTGYSPSDIAPFGDARTVDELAMRFTSAFADQFTHTVPVLPEI